MVSSCYLVNFGCFIYLLYIFGTNLLIQCQVPVPVFSVFLTLSRSDFGTVSKRNKIPKINVSRTEEDRGTWRPRHESHRGPTSLLGAPQVMARGLVASPGALCLGSQAPCVSSVPEKNFSEVLFRLDSLIFSSEKGQKHGKTGTGTWHWVNKLVPKNI